MSDLFSWWTHQHQCTLAAQVSTRRNSKRRKETRRTQAAKVYLWQFLTTVRESSVKQAEGLIRLEEWLKTLETKQEASCEKLAKKIQKEKLYSFKCKGHKVQHDFNEKVKKQQQKHFPRRIFGIRTKLQQPKWPLTKKS